MGNVGKIFKIIFRNEETGVGLGFFGIRSVRLDVRAEVASYPIERIRRIPQGFAGEGTGISISDYVRYEPPQFRVTLIDWEGVKEEGGTQELGDIWARLETIRNWGRPFTFIGPTGTYHNCMLTAIAHGATSEDGTRHSIDVTLQQILMADFLPTAFQYVVDSAGVVTGVAPLPTSQDDVVLDDPIPTSKNEDKTWIESLGSWISDGLKGGATSAYNKWSKWTS